LAALVAWFGLVVAWMQLRGGAAAVFASALLCRRLCFRLGFH